MTRNTRVRHPSDTGPPLNMGLYSLCRAGTDPAITRALEEARDPWSAVKKAMKANIDWDMVDEIAEKLTQARQ